MLKIHGLKLQRGNLMNHVLTTNTILTAIHFIRIVHKVHRVECVDNFAMIGFLLSQNQNLMMYALVMFHGYLIIAKISGSQEGLSGIGAMIINVAPVKRHFQSVNARHNQLLQTKYDCEVYFGVLSIPLIFVTSTPQ